jgi:hypothetical protein
MCNPNPQPGRKKYLGIRDLGYASMHQSPSSTHSSSFNLMPDPNFKFGKRVYLDNKMTKQEILDDHLRQIRYKQDVKKFQRDNKIREDHNLL